MDHRTKLTIRRPPRDIHVRPVGDLIDHPATRQCWCAPQLLTERRTVIVIHHAADGRDLLEAHGVQ